MLNALRRRILTAGYRSGEAQHYASALSILEIVWTLYDKIMGPDDQFVLSKAHGALALYAVLEAKGILPTAELDRLGKPGCILGGHPGPGVPGIEMACGSLGHGEPAAVGLAYAKEIRGEDGLVFCLTSDGAMQEGSVLEAFRLSRDLGLSNLRFIVDRNRSHETLHFGYPITEDALSDLSNAADRTRSSWDANVFIVDTIKGHGIPPMAKDPAAWHRRIPTPAEFAAMMEFLA